MKATSAMEAAVAAMEPTAVSSPACGGWGGKREGQHRYQRETDHLLQGRLLRDRLERGSARFTCSIVTLKPAP
jgi:hypothetical protein